MANEMHHEKKATKIRKNQEAETANKACNCSANVTFRVRGNFSFQSIVANEDEKFGSGTLGTMCYQSQDGGRFGRLIGEEKGCESGDGLGLNPGFRSSGGCWKGNASRSATSLSYFPCQVVENADGGPFVN